MEVAGLVAPKFIKIISHTPNVQDEMRLPLAFFTQYGHRLNAQFLLKIRNGYVIQVSLNRQLRKITGVNSLYTDFQLAGGEMLVFEYDGQRDFNLYIIGSDSVEIEYPNFVHHLQTSRPRKVSLRNGGFKFITFVTEEEMVFDYLECPLPLLERCDSKISNFIRYSLSNGKKFDGNYNYRSLKFLGFHNICEMLGIEDFQGINMFMFTYEQYGDVRVSAFDDNFVEIMFEGTPLTTVPNSPIPTVWESFQITVQPFHMNKYCYGVDIPAAFKHLSQWWSKTEYIRVYSGTAIWSLQIRHRSNWERTTIHDGWIQFRDDMDLHVGDVCLFECAKISSEDFVVRLLRNNA